LYREGPILPDTAFIKTGVLDDVVDFENMLPTVEAYTCNRPLWVQAIPNAHQNKHQPTL
jgi:hypothetical protein